MMLQRALGAVLLVCGFAGCVDAVMQTNVNAVLFPIALWMVLSGLALLIGDVLEDHPGERRG